ncbi:DapH/DapD/GlmU-related protein [Streptomyces sp. NPDC060184]|uniref:DapH/DapD/GlmU-related protein n=1 Tax=Streptomyces sp. NPDC060184 TaxID=3347064 RepID=UPI0036530265
MGTPLSSVHSATQSPLLSPGLLEIGIGCRISPHTLIEPADEQGALRPIRIGDHAVIGAFTILHGGTRIGDGVRIEDHVVIGKPETGYAVGRTYPGAGADTRIGDGATLRSGTVVYAGTRIGENTAVGHHTLIRSHTQLGTDSVLGHFLVIERACHFGDRVRCSPLSHLTSETVLGDDVFLGAGIRTVNDKHLIWRETDRTPVLLPPRFETGCKVGSGSTVLAGITIGERALVGSGSVVTRNVAPDTTVYGSPARPHSATTR